jgi:beta-lactam-binding protein with PASTA domain
MKRIAMLLLAVGLLLAGCSAPAPVVSASAVPVPDVVGMIGDDARDALASSGLLVEWSDDAVLLPANWKVDDQDPAAGSSAPAGSTVLLTVSKYVPATPGPNPAATPGTPLTTATVIATCDDYGSRRTPYGWKADFSADAAQTGDGGISLKAGVDVTDGFGVTTRMTVECTVDGTEQLPVVEKFDVY